MSADVRRQGRRDPHDVLGVPRGADRQQVMRAFREKARRGGHPDTGGDAQTFDEIVRAREVLLEQAHRLAAYEYRRRAPHTTVPNPRPTYSPPRKTNRLAIVTVVLALLGPFMWPVAIITGHFALRRIKQTGQGGGTLAPIVLFLLYVLTLPMVALLIMIVIA